MNQERGWSWGVVRNVWSKLVIVSHWMGGKTGKRRRRKALFCCGGRFE